MTDRDLFIAALNQDDPAERLAFLREACGTDSALRQRIEGLLKVYENAGSFLESPPASPTLSVGSTPSTEVTGTVIGPYKLLQPIGEGGMGTVYMAEQTAPVRRVVALKLIKAGMDSRQVLARFGAERQALALMDHPNIAKVFDAGTTDSGRPYFVMELVKGIPITRFCDERRLTTRERLELAIPVCQAVQHAHQKGIIHRDLKPSNVLIALYDGKPVPKVIDFGVAKATGQRLTDQTLYTEFGAVVGTLEYMSPEQAELNQLDIDTRSDIYSLGVLLYELLTGSTPLQRKRLKEAAILEVLRVIREEESPRPSLRLSTTEELPSIAACRNIEPRKLSGLVRGELDWIVMKALEKDRTRRYETANGLAADLRRYLDDEPVQACPPSAWYRFGKFARRNRVALSTAAVVLLALVLGTAVSTWQALRAREAEQNTAAALQTAEEQRGLAEQQRDLAAARTREAAERARSLEWQLYVSRVNRAHGEWSANNVAEAELLLDGCPERLRGWEWHYVKRLCHLDLLTYRGHTRAATGVAFSPDGTRVVSGAGGGWVSTQAVQSDSASYTAIGELAVWDATTGREVFALRGLVGGIECVAFRPNGQAIASGTRQGALTVWDAATGREIFTRAESGTSVLSVAFSPDGRQLASGYGGFYGAFNSNVQGRCKLWDAATGAEVLTLPGPPGGVQGLAFSPDGKRIALTGWKIVELWDLGTRQRVQTFRGHTELVTGVAFSPDGRHLASAAHDDTVRLWDVSTGDPVLILRGPTGGIYGVAFSPDGRSVAASSDDRSVTLWDAVTGAELARFRGHTTFVKTVVFSPDGHRIASACNDGMVKVWDVRTSHEVALRAPANSSLVTGIAFHPDGRRLATSWRGGILSYYETSTDSPILTIPQQARGLAFSPDSQRLASAGPGSLITLRDPETGRGVQTLRGHLADVWRLAYSPDSRRLASAGRDGTVRLWDVATSREALTLHGHVFPVTGLAFSPDGTRLSSASEHSELTVWDATTGRVIFTRQRPIHAIGEPGFSVAFSPDGRRIAWVNHTDVEVCDAATGREVRTLRGHAARVMSVAYSPDGTRIASASRDRTIKLWDSTTGEEVFTLRGHTASVHCLTFSADGHCLASGDLVATMRLWDAAPLPPERRDLAAGAPHPQVVAPSTAKADQAGDREYQGALAKRYRELAMILSHSPDRQPGDTARAIELAKKAIMMEPGDWGHQNILGLVHGKAGDWPAAEKAYRKAMELRPDQAGPINNLAWLLATCPDPQFRDPGRAVELARKAVELAPKEGTDWNTLGVAHYRAGDWKAAIEALTKSMELRKGGDSFDWFFLAMAHWQLGDKPQARSWYDKAVPWMEKNQPTDEELIRFRAEAAALLEVKKTKD